MTEVSYICLFVLLLCGSVQTYIRVFTEDVLGPVTQVLNESFTIPCLLVRPLTNSLFHICI